MKAMLLAAGRGARLRPLTNTVPKPLVKANGKTLLDYHLEKLAAADFSNVVINTSWLAQKIHQHIETNTYTINTISISHELEALETAGGVNKALPFLGEGYFLLISADIWSEFDYAEFKCTPDTIADAHLFMVANPAHNPDGDFSIEDGRIVAAANKPLTYSGIGLFHTRLFKNVKADAKVPLREILEQAIEGGSITGSLIDKAWFDVGTIERLEQLDLYIKNNTKH